MKQINDTIQFESRREIEEICSALSVYAEEHEATDNVKRLIDLLDFMHMVW